MRDVRCRTARSLSVYRRGQQCRDERDKDYCNNTIAFIFHFCFPFFDFQKSIFVRDAKASVTCHTPSYIVSYKSFLHKGVPWRVRNAYFQPSIPVLMGLPIPRRFLEYRVGGFEVMRIWQTLPADQDGCVR